MSSNLLLTAFSGATSGPKLFGIDIVWVATMLAAVGVVAVLIAVYGALTVRDPMAKRVKALNDRREQLKARSEEHTSELQSLMRTSYAVFCLKNKTYHLERYARSHIATSDTDL